MPKTMPLSRRRDSRGSMSQSGRGADGYGIKTSLDKTALINGRASFPLAKWQMSCRTNGCVSLFNHAGVSGLEDDELTELQRSRLSLSRDIGVDSTAVDASGGIGCAHIERFECERAGVALDREGRTLTTER